ncbi:rhomboid family intramembrane serine protease [Arenicella xantha]|uniref:Rhomboid family protein n=1 Tax=Arenicella xantha TaxID=644221 RepID=A0A395JPY9_9GAMM|nr:rhomboid family intramembrane serine protease [Arenicella xantha]RBP51638.1 rhomboid family protein [Arenicella xantha]
MNPEIFSLTNILVLLTCVISFMTMENRAVKAQLLFHPATIRRDKEWYRFLTSGFIHADFWHLLINMFVLWSFGNALERAYYPAFLGDGSTLKFLILYLGGIVVASIPDYFRNQYNSSYAALGASGGVSAVVFAVIIFDPWRNLYLYGIIAIPQILAGAGYLYYSWIKDKRANDNIGHMAHFSGAIWGFMFTGLMNFELFGRFITKTLAGPNWW